MRRAVQLVVVATKNCTAIIVAVVQRYWLPGLGDAPEVVPPALVVDRERHQGRFGLVAREVRPPRRPAVKAVGLEEPPRLPTKPPVRNGQPTVVVAADEDVR